MAFRTSKCHQHNSRSLYSRGYRRDHASQISARQSNPAVSTPINSAQVGVSGKTWLASQRTKSSGAGAIFRATRDPHQATSAKPCHELGETYAYQKINVRCRRFL